MMRFREVIRRAVLALGAAVLMLLALEGLLRGFVIPSPRSAGRLFGSELPPVRLIPAEPPRPPRRDSQVKRVRYDDLNGIVRDDPVLGYAPREHAISTNGWWQSNNLGARARRDTAPTVASGTRRVLVFGDSFAAGSRVAQESAWPAVLEAAEPGLEVVNLGVDGYSLAQSLLRYRGLREAVAHDVVVLTLSPRADLWRDVNTLRALLGWQSYRVMPRFVLDGGLELVPSPYNPPVAVHADNASGLGPRLRDHLRRYDRFYVPWMWEPTSGLPARSVLVKFILARWHAALMRRRQEEALEPGSEAVAVSARIVQTMRAEAAARGAGFVLVLLPSEIDLGRLRRRRGYRDEWRAIATAIARDGVACVDLADALVAAPADRIDRGIDGTHHGPRANQLIATVVGRALAAPAAACGAGASPPGS
ncbi:MAG: hypothetical protein E6J75_16615 [Deltaproteobacteria bacterium]|nr:MAG: hypothetical protein E6J75_16615 [Deltaproteobacteria bacterium]